MSSLNVSGAFIYFVIPIFGGIPITQTTVSSLIVTIILIVLSIKLGKNLQKRPTGVQVLVEKGVSMLYGMVAETMGEHNLYWAPFIGTIFLSSILGSRIGMTGLLRSMTADLSCTLVWAVLVSVLIWYNNIKNNGFVGWLKGFTEPIVVMTPMNIIGEIAQPVSMAFRHFGKRRRRRRYHQHFVSGTVPTLQHGARADCRKRRTGSCCFDCGWRRLDRMEQKDA